MLIVDDLPNRNIKKLGSELSSADSTLMERSWPDAEGHASSRGAGAIVLLMPDREHESLGRATIGDRVPDPGVLHTEFRHGHATRLVGQLSCGSRTNQGGCSRTYLS